MPEQWDDSRGSRWQCPEPCLSIVSKFSRRPERADADVSVSDARNSFLKGDRMAVMAAVAAVLSCGPINIQTTSLICSTSQLLKRKTEDTGAGKKCTARMRRTRSSRFRSERWFTDGGVRSEGERSDNSIPDFENSIDDEEIVGLARRLPDDQSAIHDTQSDLLADLAREDQEFLLCKGGAGGKGNVHFKSSRNRAPREYTEGGEGESGNFLLELRSIADVALVGYPNAGKSTLIQQISAARSKIAPYPFTTLHPVIGIVELGDYRRATVADIPGLIEGAHRNLGLGHDFLRHITRCRLLLFVLDMAGSEGRSPIADLESLRREIALYHPRLSERPWFVVANKMDLPQAKENLRDFQKRFPQRTIVPISAKEGRGISELKRLLGEWMPSALG